MKATQVLYPCCIAVGLAVASPAKAAQSYDNCSGFIDSIPATLTTQGVWCLRADLSTAIASGNAITIATNNVTVDCNHFKLGGLAAGTGTTANGIYALNRLNAVVRNCNIRGFFQGVQLAGTSSGGHVIEDSRFDGNTYIGIRVSSPYATVRNNLVFDTGGSTIYLDAYAIAFESANGSEASGNSVSGVAPTGNGSAYGIWLGGAPEITLRNNLVRNLLGSGSGTAYGIFSAATNGVVMDGNILHGPNSPGSNGILCPSNAGTATRNTVRRFSTGVSGCVQLDNVVNNN